MSARDRAILDRCHHLALVAMESVTPRPAAAPLRAAAGPSGPSGLGLGLTAGEATKLSWAQPRLLAAMSRALSRLA